MAVGNRRVAGFPTAGAGQSGERRSGSGSAVGSMETLPMYELQSLRKRIATLEAK